ncbi:alpha/beta hydrolase [Pseudohoeflea coraliihabitans]|uniref:Alpha/beta hydrolase n=1 Tax=Pseudohoeflea coraliihabitans TaxID=2860393 RepID=A0ABS6WNP3_9HYPH|nr:alpha/beta hydrolase [Pseudohoeflea sp. DP4N28-3]MBW3097571.1 alpha/beta hydrolase [Pseudohoeflea sp. DP4N28-3]
MTPIGGTVPGASTVAMLVATTRAGSGDIGQPYSGERGEAVELDAVEVSIPPERNRTIGEVQWPKKLPPDPETDFATLTTRNLEGRSEASSWFKTQRASNGRLLVFVHGFNNRYEDAVYRFAQITHDSGTGATPLLFTWPSRGSVFAYGYDKESTNYSRSALEAVLAAAADESAVDEVTVLAHSMGTWLTVEALRQLAIREGRIPRKISNVILAAPDLDIDVFRQQLADMGPDRPKFTIFVSRDDRALSVSRRISGNIDRLGQVDIEDPAIRSQLEQEGITVLDLSKLQGGDRLNHSKFSESPEVVRLLGDRLIAGQTITDQDIGLGAELGATALSITNTVGSAAGVAVSVPISIVDPSTRDNLDAQVDRFGENLNSSLRGAVPVPRSRRAPRADPACASGGSACGPALGSGG